MAVEYEGAHGEFSGRLELVGGFLCEVDASGAYWLTEDRHHRRLRRRPDVPTFPAGWESHEDDLVPELTDEDYVVPASYNAVATDGSRIVPGDTVRFLDRLGIHVLEGTVASVPGMVTATDACGCRYDVCWDDVEAVTVPTSVTPPGDGVWLVDRGRLA